MVFLGLGLAFGALVFALTRKMAPSVVTLLVVTWLAYTNLPTLAWGFYGIPMLLLVALTLAASFLPLYERSGENRTALGGVVALGVLTVLFLVVVPFVSTTAMGRSQTYRNLIGPVDTLTNAPDLAPFDPSQVRVVDHAMAVKLADKRLGEVTALGSQVEVGEMTIQAVRGQLLWVAPLNHSGFFKWLNNSEGTPGYITVSATNPSDVKLVQEACGGPIRLRYNDGAFFGDDVERYVYSKGYVTRGLTDLTFEITDEGCPHYVVTVYDNKVGFGGEDAVGVVVLDAQTGALAFHTPEDAPAWVDRIQPGNFVTTQINDWGEYAEGWWNPSNRNKLTSTPGLALVYGKNGRSYFYTGITSVGSDEGTVGYMLVDTRTKEATFYKQPGATETAAQSAAANALPEKGFQAEFPIPGNVAGAWTYVIPLTNAENQLGAVALVNVQDYQIIGVGPDAVTAMRDYQAKLASRGGQIAMDVASDRERVTGRVVRLGEDMRQGNKDYYLLIEGSEHLAFVGASSVSPELPFTREGDVVTIGYDATGKGVVYVLDFDNQGLNFTTSPAQETVDVRADSVRSVNVVRQNAQDADAEWERLSPESKAEILAQARRESSSPN